MIEASEKYLRFNAISSHNHGFFRREKFGNEPKLETAIARFIIRHICDTVSELPHKMSQIEDWACAMFVSQHHSATIKASAQGSS